MSDPDYLVGSHAFDLVVNRGGWIDEADTGNNTYSPNLTITIPPEFCSMLPDLVVTITGPARACGSATST
jgi:hypothetical protein